jgi:hypothetical protein
MGNDKPKFHFKKNLIVTSVFFSLSGLMLFSCKNKKGLRLETVLQNKCAWDVIFLKQDSIPRYCLRFKSKGLCYYFKYVFNKRNKTDSVVHYNDGDNIMPNTWEVQGDSILFIRGQKVYVSRITQDSIYLNDKVRLSVILVKNCFIKSKSEYWE